MHIWPSIHPKECTAEDVRFFQLLCHGQIADFDSDVDIHIGASAFGFCKSLLGSDIFARSVLLPLHLGKNAAHIGFNDTEISLLQRGLKRHFGLRRVAESDLSHWIAALQVATESLRFLKAFSAAQTSFSAGWLQQQLLETPAHDASFLITAKIEQITSGTVRGHAYNQADPKKCLMLDFFINDTFVGASQTGYVPHNTTELEDVAPEADFTHTDWGFAHTINLPEHIAEKTRLFLSIFEHETGTLACPVIEFPALHIRHTLLVQHLSKKLAVAKSEGAVSAAVESIEKALPAIQQYAAMPPEHYTLYHQFYQADTPPEAKGTLPTITVAQAPDYAYNSKADIVVFLMENTQISPQSLQWVQHHAAQNPGASLFYGSYIMSSQGGADYPVFNAAFDSDLLLQQPANARAYAVRQHHLEETGGIASGTPEDHLALWLHLLARHGETAFHPVPEAIWQIDTALNGTKKAEGKAPNEDGDENGAISAVNDYFSAIKSGATPQKHSDRYGGPVPDALTVEWPIDPDLPKLAIIIPTRDALVLVRGCVESLRKTLRHPEATEIIIMDNGSTDPDTKDWLKQADGMDGIRVLLHDAPFNWSEMNNRAVENSDADYFLFLNNDTIALDTGWDHILRGYLNRDDVGMVGARLFFEDGTLQFAGYITDEKNIALKEAYRENPQRGGYRDRSKLAHRCTALIGAFLACRRDVFDEAGGFDAGRFPIAFNDIDFCLTVGKLGYKNLYVPAISFNHLESISRGYDAQDAAKAKREANERQLMREKWGDTLNNDPWYPSAFLPQEPTHSLLAAPKKATITKQA